MDREFTITCGGLEAPDDSEQRTHINLNLWGGSGEENLVLHSDDIRRFLLKDVLRQFQDLCEIAAYVYCADQLAPRTNRNDVDSFGGHWRRRFQFQIPVRCPDVWNRPEVITCLTGVLGFLSDDHYAFSFHAAAAPPGFQQYLEFAESQPLSGSPESVVMFSGGLDSLAGVVDEVLVQKRRVAMVSHRSTPKNALLLRTLGGSIKERAGPLSPCHVVVRANKRKSDGKEYTQRTRSFLFASFGATIAKMLGINQLRFYENGVVSLNLPICTQVVGGRATRTTHPRTLLGFQKLFSLIGGESFHVENPFLWKTKAEVIELIKRAGHGDLIAASISCAHTWERSHEFTHCGICSQCIDRRIAIVAAEAEPLDPEERYKHDIFTGTRPKDDDKIMLAAYLERANEVAKVQDVPAFLVSYPQVSRAIDAVPGDPQSIAERMLDLYKRHAAEVEKAVSIMTGRHAKDLFKRRLPPECLLRIVTESNAVASVPAWSAPDPLPENFFWRRGNVWEARYQGGKEFLIQSHQKGCQYLRYLLPRAHEGRSVFEIVAEVYATAIIPESANLDVTELGSGYAVTQGPQRSDLGGVVDDVALRDYRHRLKELAEELAEERRDGNEVHIKMLEDEVIEIEQALSAATDRRGRPRKTSDGRKNLRDAFRNSITRTIQEIRKHDSVFAEHLSSFIDFKGNPEYRPPISITWSTQA